MREVDRTGLVEGCRDPYDRHHLDLRLVRRAWLDGAAVVVQHGTTWPDAPAGATAALAIGPPGDLDPLVAAVARVWAYPWRVVVAQGSAGALPRGWSPVAPHGWRWMTTATAPAPDAVPGTGPGGHQVEDVSDPVDLAALLERAGRSTFARPDDPSITWVGARVDDELVAVGGLSRTSATASHLRGVATAADHRGRGLATAISAELTRRAVGDGTGLATLGVFSDNPTAIGVYKRLGFETVHEFTAGLTSR